MGASHGDISESVHTVTRTTAATTRANRDSIRRVRGFGKGTGKHTHTPSPGRIDTLFLAQRSTTEEDDASAQTDDTSPVDGNDFEDSDAPSDDATDT